MKSSRLNLSIFISILAIVGIVGSQGLSQNNSNSDSSAMMGSDYATAYFAGGCFWCTESDYEKYDGVFDAVSGYIGGHVENPTYNQITRGNTGHREAVEVQYDPSVISYQKLLDIFWRIHDPSDAGGSFVYA